jgi:hypothetical protein
MMPVQLVKAVAAAFLHELPQQVHDSLEGVSVQIVVDPPPGVPSNVKAMFVGRQQMGDPEDDDDCDAGAWFDYGPTGELEMVEHGGVLLAEGTIYLLARNLETPDDAKIALAHETGHALGLDEAEVAELGLE